MSTTRYVQYFPRSPEHRKFAQLFPHDTEILPVITPSVCSFPPFVHGLLFSQNKKRTRMHSKTNVSMYAASLKLSPLFAYLFLPKSLLPFLNLPRRFSSLQVDPPALYLARIHMRVSITSFITLTIHHMFSACSLVLGYYGYWYYGPLSNKSTFDHQYGVDLLHVLQVTIGSAVTTTSTVSTGGS
ncbi:hypothetical protein C8Q75DRAFT_57249 [Abortiporus biennis]|nr:hypothetical protein C8Q75DRAFT_57249 [Abortiporus biennis]